MLAVVLGVLALVVVFAIAAAVVGRETSRLVEEAPRPVFDMDEAVAWVAANLPFEVAAELSHDDVRRILGWSLERLAAAGAAGNGHAPASPAPTVVATGETVDHVLVRAREEELELTAPQVHAVVDAELGYLQAIGAMGPPEDVGPGGAGNPA